MENTFLIYNTKASDLSRVLDEKYLPTIEDLCSTIKFAEEEFDIPNEEGDMVSETSSATFITMDPENIPILSKRLKLPLIVDYIDYDPLTGEDEVFTLEIYDAWRE